MKIVFLTDSYGGLRVTKGVTEVFPEQTYPELVRREMEKRGHSVEIDFRSFRKVTELPGLIEKYPGRDVYVLQAGVVDIYPRVISYKMTASQAFFPKAVRKIIRMRRRFFIRYIRRITWSSKNELITAINRITSTLRAKAIWINVAPVNARMESDTPGANKAISDYNEMLRQLLTDKPGHQVLDVHSDLIARKNMEDLLHQDDSHLNIEGNKLYAEKISEQLLRIPGI